MIRIVRFGLLIAVGLMQFVSARYSKSAPFKLTLRWAESSCQPEDTQKIGVELSRSEGKPYLHQNPIVTQADIVGAAYLEGVDSGMKIHTEVRLPASQANS